MLSYIFEHAVAGIWDQIWHWGTAVGLIILLVAAAYFTTAIPVIGPYLQDARKDLLWAALGIFLFTFGMGVGTKDEKKICTAQTVVVTKFVDKAVAKTKLPKAHAEKDPFDNPEN
jgi:Ni,Fe-hydrogenase I cytochrome b subunit